jgi:hypothetical protein
VGEDSNKTTTATTTTDPGHTSSGAAAAGGNSTRRCLFLDIVVGWLLDGNRDGRVDKSELYRLQLLGDEYAQLPELVAEGVARPKTMLQLLDVLYEGFDRTSLLGTQPTSPTAAAAAALPPSPLVGDKQPALTAPATGATGVHDSTGPLATGPTPQQYLQGGTPPPSPGIAKQVLAGLGMSQVLASYNTASLLDDYVPGSRQWMHDRVMAWLDQRPPMEEGGGSSSATGSRMFLLIAGVYDR